MALSEYISNYHRISSQLEQAITEDNTAAVAILDAELQTEFNAILACQSNGRLAAEELVIFLLERLQPAHFRSPIEVQICEKIAQLISPR